MKIGLIDVDGHNFPNLPLMKISAWHKALTAYNAGSYTGTVTGYARSVLSTAGKIEVAR